VEKAVFLDRDGTIIEDAGYIGEIDRVRFLRGSGKAIKLLNENNYKVIVITNQAGVARGYFTEEAVREVNNYISESLARENARIDGFYYCPHHIDGVVEEYRKDCYNRKPKPGMVEQAARDFDIDLAQSFIIGDNMSDIEAGHRAGCRSIFLSDVKLSDKVENSIIVPDFTVPSLFKAVTLLLEFDKSQGFDFG
jgi:D,D-heptose 1,7-bisphosphate phosphatase